MSMHAKLHHVATAAIVLASASVSSAAVALDAGGAASGAAGGASGAAGAASGAGASAAGAASGAASSAAGAASSAAGTVGNAAGTASGAVGGTANSAGGRGLGRGLPSTFSPRGFFGLESNAYGRVSRSVSRSRGGRKAVQAHKPTHHKPPRETQVIDSGSGGGVASVRSRRMCGDILSDPAGYDPALVRLCRRVSTR
jgi:hypothetical protein